MAYQRILTPRIYTDNINWMLSLGQMVTGDITLSGLSIASGYSLLSMFDMKPANLQTITANGISTQGIIKIDTGLTTDITQDANFIAILGHNLKSADVKFKLQTDDDTDFGTAQSPALTEVVNIGGDVSSGDYATPAYNGWSLFTFTQASDNAFIRLIIDAETSNYDADIKIGALLLGEYIDLPHSPDLSIKKQIIYDGVKKQNSTGGQTYSNATWLKSPDWVTHAYGGIQIGANPLTKSGRTHLDMNFSYLADTDVFPAIMYNYNYLTAGNDIVSNLVFRTHGGHFPFLFQFDKDTTTVEDAFMYCRLAKEPTFTQVANQTWNSDISLIEEI